MHKLKVLITGPDSFISTLIELKSYLKFNLLQSNENTDINTDCDALLLHGDMVNHYINNSATIKILASNSLSKNFKYDAFLKLPASIGEINSIVENSVIKRKFIKNSSIKIKEYFLDKNEKKLLNKENNFIILTEKEVQLLELFLESKISITKKEILTRVWHYSSDADTHTVETHIYRLRKKINEKFLDEEFILNDKNGYYL